MFMKRLGYVLCIPISAIIETCFMPCELCAIMMYNGDLRKGIITRTNPTNFKDNMEYDGVDCKYCIPPAKAGFETKFIAPFGEVRILYNKHYSIEEKNETAFVIKLYINGIEEDIQPIGMRNISNHIIQGPDSIVMEYCGTN